MLFKNTYAKKNWIFQNKSEREKGGYYLPSPVDAVGRARGEKGLFWDGGEIWKQQLSTSFRTGLENQQSGAKLS